MPLRSIGLTWTVICSNDATFRSGATITEPDSVFGSMRAIRRVNATVEAYSVPWLPATNATTLPGRAPWITATGKSVAASLPAGTCRSP